MPFFSLSIYLSFGLIKTLILNPTKLKIVQSYGFTYKLWELDMTQFTSMEIKGMQGFEDNLIFKREDGSNFKSSIYGLTKLEGDRKEPLIKEDMKRIPTIKFYQSYFTYLFSYYPTLVST